MTNERADLLGDVAPYIDVVQVDPGDVDRWWSALQSSAERARPGAVVRLVDGARCATTAGLFEEVAAALSFPDYFGGGWDAFEDCVNDLGWLPAPAYVVVVSGAEALLSAASTVSLATLDAVLNRETAVDASSADAVVPLRFVLVTAHPEPLVQRLGDAGARFALVAA